MAYAYVGISFPDGARYQIKACRKLRKMERFGDLGFLNDPATHVVMVWDENNVIEARGGKVGKVTLCSKRYWIRREGFMRWYRPRILL